MESVFSVVVMPAVVAVPVAFALVTALVALLASGVRPPRLLPALPLLRLNGPLLLALRGPLLLSYPLRLPGLLLLGWFLGCCSWCR